MRRVVVFFTSMLVALSFVQAKALTNEEKEFLFGSSVVETKVIPESEMAQTSGKFVGIPGFSTPVDMFPPVSSLYDLIQQIIDIISQPGDGEIIEPPGDGIIEPGV
ncbi:hypothetical protein [Persephonella sp.]